MAISRSSPFEVNSSTEDGCLGPFTNGVSTMISFDAVCLPFITVARESGPMACSRMASSRDVSHVCLGAGISGVSPFIKSYVPPKIKGKSYL